MTETARLLKVSKPTVSYHARKLGIPAMDKFSCRYDWAEVQRYYDEGHSITECQAHFGFARKSFWDAACRGDVITRPQAMPIDELLASPRNRGHIKRRLLAVGLKQNQCERCGTADWCGEPLTLALHHVNGERHDTALSRGGDVVGV